MSQELHRPTLTEGGVLSVIETCRQQNRDVFAFGRLVDVHLLQLILD